MKSTVRSKSKRPVLSEPVGVQAPVSVLYSAQLTSLLLLSVPTASTARMVGSRAMLLISASGLGAVTLLTCPLPVL